MPWGTAYPSAPGYETYAPTAAYQYSPAVGTDALGGYPAYGGGGDGFLSGGGSSGGSDTSTLGGALSALSLLGGANDLSSFLTGKSLMEHAGIPNPSGLDLQALNPFSDTPLTALFGDAGRNLGLAASQYPNALAGGVGGSVGIGPSGYLSLDALAGQVNPFASAGLPAGNAAPLTPVTAAELPANLSLGVPDVFNPVTNSFASDAYLSPAFNSGMAGGIEGASGLGGSIGLGGPGTMAGGLEGASGLGGSIGLPAGTPATGGGLLGLGAGAGAFAVAAPLLAYYGITEQQADESPAETRAQQTQAGQVFNQAKDFIIEHGRVPGPEDGWHGNIDHLLRMMAPGGGGGISATVGADLQRFGNGVPNEVLGRAFTINDPEGNIVLNHLAQETDMIGVDPGVRALINSRNIDTTPSLAFEGRMRQDIENRFTYPEFHGAVTPYLQNAVGHDKQPLMETVYDEHGAEYLVPAPPPPPALAPPPTSEPKNYAGSVRLGGNLIYRDGKIHRLAHSGDSASSGNIIRDATAAQIAAYGSAGRGAGGGTRFVDP